jgi:hypothetical protein
MVRSTHTKFWLGNLERRDNSEDLDIDGEILLEQGKWMGRYRLGS